MPTQTGRKSSPPSTQGSRASTPRPYLSWSQFDCFRRSPEEYRQRYFRGKRLDTEATRLGSRVAEALEAEDGDALPPGLLASLPVFDRREHELSADCEGVPLFGRLDGWDEATRTVHEVKTGTVKWTQRRADGHGQLTFYALMTLLSTGSLPSRVLLHWLPTKRVGGRLELVGTVTTFETARTLADAAKLAAEIKTTWKDIKTMFREEVAKF